MTDREVKVVKTCNVLKIGGSGNRASFRLIMGHMEFRGSSLYGDGSLTIGVIPGSSIRDQGSRTGLILVLDSG